jgi:type VI secretion system secreted protein Hcp
MAFQHYMSLKGNSQGQMKGASTKGSRHDKWIEVIAFKAGVISPRDVASGSAAGKRTHKPIVITKETDAASPQLLQAHWSGEVLPEVIVETRLNGHVVKRITLSDAVLAAIGRSLRQGSTKGQKTNSLEDYSFTFEKILVENLGGSTSTTDDWTAANS